MIAALPLISSALSMLTSTDSAGAASHAAKTVSGASEDFSSVLSKTASNAFQTVKTAEQASTEGLKGNADVQSVVQAVMTAQENLQTALAIRDKAVAAFTEISHMAI
jgi:flagellar hook-basal body complex protein FliE